MDFFAHQDRAHHRTRWLVVGFLVSVVAVVAALDFAAWLAYDVTAPHRGGMSAATLLVLVSAGTLLLIVIGSAYRWGELSKGGGEAVALALGGRRVVPGQASPAEKRLLNVVEEMSIAAGVPVPQVFVLGGEHGINAFAAGLTRADAVVTVTQGALDHLTRDELQGVVAHEFSHVLNGDMRINLRLIGLVFGILLIALTGRTILWSLRYARPSRGKGGGAIGVALLIGLALLVLGGIGWIAGRLLEAAVSRQRELLADASAVQFTRNPDGLSGALMKLLHHGTRIQNVRAGEMPHLFLGNPLGPSLFATHPPLEKRLDAIDPHWREKALRRLKSEVERPGRATPTPAATPAPASAVARVPLPTSALAAGAVAGLVGNLEAARPEAAGEHLAEVPANVREAIEEPFSARAAVLAAVADPRAGIARPALASLSTYDAKLAAEAIRLHPRISALGSDKALTVVLLALPALQLLTRDQSAVFLRALEALIRSDGVVTLHEFALGELCSLHLGMVPSPGTPTASAFRKAAADLLAGLARSGTDDEVAAKRAYEQGREQLGIEYDMPPAPLVPWETLRAAIRTCRGARGEHKRRLVSAAAHVVASDGVVTPTEAELLRLVADALGCPMPRV